MKGIAVLLGSLLLCMDVYAVDGIAVQYGDSGEADLMRVSALWKMKNQWFTDGDWQVTGLWEASIGRWQGYSNTGSEKTVTDIGFAPVLRLEKKVATGCSPYLEGSSGIHLISPTRINAARSFGSSVQFASHLGAGLRFGTKLQYDLAFRYQHISNASIKAPNSGINFNQLNFAYHF